MHKRNFATEHSMSRSPSEPSSSFGQSLFLKPPSQPMVVSTTPMKVSGLIQGGQERGIAKVVQDVYFVNQVRVGEVEGTLIVVMDGHGPDGHRVAEFVRKVIGGEIIRILSTDGQ